MRKRIPWNKGLRGLQTAWNKGLTKETDERMRKISEHLKQSNAMSGKHHTPEAKAKIGAASKAHWQNPEYRVKILMGIKRLWKQPWYRQLMSNSAKKQWQNPKYQEFRSNVVKQQWQDPEHQESMSRLHKKKWKDSKYRKQIISKMREQWQDPEFREKRIRAIMEGIQCKPNNKEQKLIDLFRKNGLPYEFVGDGKMILNGYNPDFINVDGQKKIIELFGDYWHKDEKLEYGGDGGQTRREIFAAFGYSTLIIWEYELADENRLSKKIINFHRITNE